MADKSKDNFAKYFDLLVSKDYKKEVFFLDSVFRKFGKVKSVIDLGCGTGNHAIHLTKIGYNVIGIDIDEGMVQVASKKAKNEKLNIIFLKQDIRNLQTDKKFDAAIAMWAAFQEIVEDEEVRKSLEKIYSSLNDGGIFVLDCENPEMIIKYHKDLSVPSVIDTEDVKIVTIFKKKLDLNNKVLSATAIALIEDQGKLSLKIEKKKLKLLFLEEVKKILEDANFEILDALGDYDLNNKFDLSKGRMLLIAKKLK